MGSSNWLEVEPLDVAGDRKDAEGLGREAGATFVIKITGGLSSAEVMGDH
jgi:hypothetical protein